MERTFNILDIGYSYVMKFICNGQNGVDTLMDAIIESRASAFMIYDWVEFPLKYGEVIVFLFRTTHAKAYTLYQRFSGRDISPISSECIKGLLESCGCTLEGIHTPCIYRLGNTHIYTKENIKKGA